MTIVDLSKASELARVIEDGSIWYAPGWAKQMAIEAINSGEVPVPEYIPDEYRNAITRTDAPALPAVEPAAPGQTRG